MSIEAMKQALDVLENTARSAVEQYVAEQKAISALRQAIEQAELAKPEQTPYFCKDCGKGLLGEGHIHTCSPQVKRQWVGLTDEEIKELLDCGRGGLVDIKKAEQMLKEKNTILNGNKND